MSLRSYAVGQSQNNALSVATSGAVGADSEAWSVVSARGHTHISDPRAVSSAGSLQCPQLLTPAPAAADPGLVSAVCTVCRPTGRSGAARGQQNNKNPLIDYLDTNVLLSESKFKIQLDVSPCPFI